jgi:Thiopurine S-methyltransferase (TPMT)
MSADAHTGQLGPASDGLRDGALSLLAAEPVHWCDPRCCRFLCALPPEQREDWARGWARLIAAGGELVTMMFPVDPEKEGGPPYAVSPDLYTELLTPVGECGKVTGGGL